MNNYLAAAGGEIQSEIGNKALPIRYRLISPEGFFSGLIQALITGLFVIAFIFFMFNILIGGLSWINSGGDKAKLEKARGQIVNAVIGVIIVISVFAFVTLLESVFGISITVFDIADLQIAP